MALIRPSFVFADEVKVFEPIPIVQQYCSCVSYLRNFIPNTPHVDARWFQTFNRTTPAVGRVALLQYGDVSHVAYISEIKEDGMIVKEANFTRCKKGTRFIPWSSKEIVGFWDADG